MSVVEAFEIEAHEGDNFSESFRAMESRIKLSELQLSIKAVSVWFLMVTLTRAFDRSCLIPAGTDAIVWRVMAGTGLLNFFDAGQTLE